MEKVKKHIDDAFRLISTIPVVQDNVEVMASAKEHLRAAFALLTDMEKREEVQDGG